MITVYIEAKLVAITEDDCPAGAMALVVSSPQVDDEDQEKSGRITFVTRADHARKFAPYVGKPVRIVLEAGEEPTDPDAN